MQSTLQSTRYSQGTRGFNGSGVEAEEEERKRRKKRKEEEGGKRGKPEETPPGVRP